MDKPPYNFFNGKMIIMYPSVKSLVKTYNFVLIAFAMSYSCQLQLPLTVATDHMKDGLLEDLLLH